MWKGFRKKRQSIFNSLPGRCAHRAGSKRPGSQTVPSFFHKTQHCRWAVGTSTRAVACASTSKPQPLLILNSTGAVASTVKSLIQASGHTLSCLAVLWIFVGLPFTRLNHLGSLVRKIWNIVVPVHSSERLTPFALVPSFFPYKFRFLSSKFIPKSCAAHLRSMSCRWFSSRSTLTTTPQPCWAELCLWRIAL